MVNCTSSYVCVQIGCESLHARGTTKQDAEYVQSKTVDSEQERVSETENVSEKMTKQGQPEESMAEVEPVAIKESNALEETSETRDINIP